MKNAMALYVIHMLSVSNPTINQCSANANKAGREMARRVQVRRIVKNTNPVEK